MINAATFYIIKRIEAVIIYMGISNLSIMTIIIISKKSQNPFSKGIESLPQTQIFESLYLYNRMV